ncbi:MAG: DUF423 domain-containing protein [Methylacidiphilales bacterium]|nr:DUF423 domain-containing protein [Candidatus Methylacidiphilales bacterium]NJR15910.1 DUF423 domain-containing protein [Calothrix sp. CSU_2_0]
MKQIFLSIAAILGGLSVAAGAFASHSLRGQISDRIIDSGYHQRALEIFEVGTRYQMYHALALLAVAILLKNQPSPSKSLIVSGWLFIIGILLFSGSLYALSLTTIAGLGLITPIGGVALICGWGALAISAMGESRD